MGDNLDPKNKCSSIALNSKWPIDPDNKLIPTEEFLSACKPVVVFIESLGKLFTPLKSDVEGNLKKLEAKYKEDQESNKFIQIMLLNEKQKSKSNLTIDAMLWLKRGLHFIYIILHSLVEDFNAGVKTESMQAHTKKAYDISLRPHHNFVVQKLFVILNHAIPTRRGVYDCLGGQNIPEDEIVKQLVPFVDGLKFNLECINEFYANNEFDSLVKLL